MPSKSNTSMKPSVIDKDGDSRRRFLAACGRLSVATPPAIALLLASAEKNYAHALSGGSGDQSDLLNRVPGGGAGGGGRGGFRIFGVRIL
jgi:hypothetical protein